jgi:amino acid transporter
MFGILKRLLIGRPIATSDAAHQTLTKRVALPVFASDAISSTAYATEEILVVLVPVAAFSAYKYLVPLAIMVVILLALVVFSYRQTIHAYPEGGGSYMVTRDNLGSTPALLAGSSLLVDYVMTVAVSVASGIAAITSAFHGLRDYRVGLAVIAVAFMMLVNLRGTKESGALFAPPTYIYVISLAAMITYGLYRVFFQDLGEIPDQEEHLRELVGTSAVTTGASMFILMRAFSSGAVALTGVEAMADGVPAFRPPAAKNASTTLAAMGVILGALFFGTAVLGHHLKPVPQEGGETVLSLLAGQVFGASSPLYYVLQFSTFAILILAANTAYADFPRLSSFIARDGFLPRQFGNRGDRLVFSNGIIVLSVFAMALIVGFGADVSRLIPLYAVGVFTGFTLSQLAMLQRLRTRREPGWQVRAVISGVGAAATGLVMVVVVVSKFTIGAWIPALVIPSLVLALRAIGRHYERVRDFVAVPEGWKPKRHRHFVVVPVGSINKGVLNAITYARSLAPDRIIAVSVIADAEEQERIQEEWARYGIPVELHTIYSPYRDLTEPVLAYLDEIDRSEDDDIITVVIPEFVTDLKTQWLHNQSALQLKLRLLYRPNTVVTSVPILVD